MFFLIFSFSVSAVNDFLICFSFSFLFFSRQLKFHVQHFLKGIVFEKIVLSLFFFSFLFFWKYKNRKESRFTNGKKIDPLCGGSIAEEFLIVNRASELFEQNVKVLKRVVLYSRMNFGKFIILI